MPRKPKTLLVFPNPYLSLDEDGHPAAFVVRVDFRPNLVGARRGPARFKGGPPSYSYDEQPTELPDLPEYRHFLRTGELIAANPATAQLAGLPGPFREPAAVLAESAERAAKRFEEEHGEPPPFAAPAAAEASAKG
jgi:hypothetical protein